MHTSRSNRLQSTYCIAIKHPLHRGSVSPSDSEAASGGCWRKVDGLDGGHHFTTEQQNKDINRDAYLKTLGITVLRFTNLEILQQIHAVLSKIEGTISWLTSPRCHLAIARRHRPPVNGVFDR